VRKKGSLKGDTVQSELESKAEEFPLIEAVARERLVKTQQAGKDFVNCGD
jgi:hypothetical protein